MVLHGPDDPGCRFVVCFFIECAGGDFLVFALVWYMSCFSSAFHFASFVATRSVVAWEQLESFSGSQLVQNAACQCLEK